MKVSIMEKIITKEKIFIVQEELKDYKKMILFGKGPSFQIKEKKLELFFCGNDAMNFVDCDVLCINDFESTERINKERLNDVKFILLPNNPHIRKRPDKSMTYNNIVEVFDLHFKGNYIVYNLKTSKENDDFITLNTMISVSNTALEFTSKYLKNIKDVETYGIGIMQNYSDVFYYNGKKNQSSESKNKDWINCVKDDIVNNCNANKLNLKMN